MLLPQHDTPPQVKRFKYRLAQQHLSVALVFKPETTFHLAGFNPIINSTPTIVIVTPNHDPIVLVHVLRAAIANSSPWVTDVRLYGGWSGRKSNWEKWDQALAATLEEVGVANGLIGIERSFISLLVFQQLKRSLPEATFADIDPLVQETRVVKDADEVANAHIAGELAQRGMQVAIAALSTGSNEQEAVVVARGKMEELWITKYPEISVGAFGSLEAGQHNGLDAWVLSGPRKFLNCDAPKPRKPLEGETTSVFIWAVANGIRAEIERTVCFGRIPLREKEAIKAICHIRRDIAGQMKAGTTVRRLFQSARNGFEDYGFGRYLPERIGHTIGLGGHEAFSIADDSPLILQPGILITLEPHIQIPGVCATQFSDTYLITNEGSQCLTGGPIDVEGTSYGS